MADTITKRMLPRQGSKAAAEQANEVLLSGEFFTETDTGRIKRGDGVTPYRKLLSFTEEADIALESADRIYKGQNLAVKFADEIAGYLDIYEWLQARKAAGNYKGIHIGDYFTFTSSAGTIGGTNIPAQTFTARIIGIDTHYRAADTDVGHHIDFCTDQVVDQNVLWNPTDNNNGTSVQSKPWLASNVYAWLNGVNNYTTSAYNNQAHGGNYNNAGMLQRLPARLQAVIIQKRNILDDRYSASGLITGGTGWGWADMGKLWLPNEIEVYGTQIRSNLCQTNGYWNPEANLSVQYPWFAASITNRIKYMSNGARATWWLSSAASRGTGYACGVTGAGSATSVATTYTVVRVPLCFRI